jgi:hypothetical protein
MGKSCCAAAGKFPRTARPRSVLDHPEPVDVDAVLFWVVWDAEKAALEVEDYKQDMEDAMSRQAQAERERQARVILGESERQIAKSFSEASKAYINNPTALHLRAMNMLFEGLKEKGALVIVPSSAVDTMNLGGLSGMVSLAQNNKPKE